MDATGNVDGCSRRSSLRGGTGGSETGPAGSPVQSRLREMLHNLRPSEGDSLVSLPSGKNLAKRLSASNGSKDDVVKPYAGSLLPRSSVSVPIPTKSPRNSVSHPMLKASINGMFKKRSRTPPVDDTKQEVLDVDSDLAKSIGHIKIPDVFLDEGLPLLKVSLKSKKRIHFKIDPSTFRFSWQVAGNASSMVSSNTIHRIITQSSSKVHEFSLDDIKTVSFGQDAANYREELCLSKDIEDKWITIIYYVPKGNRLKQLHLIADTGYDFKRLKSSIKNLKKLRENLARTLLIDVSEMDEAKRNLIVGNNKQIKQFLSFGDILKYSKRLNINLNHKYLESIFNQVAENGDQGLTFDEFRRFVSILKQRRDIYDIFQRICKGTDQMSFETFKDFVTNTQKETYSEDKLSKIFKKFTRGSNVNYWTSEIFNNFLLSKYSVPIQTLEDEQGYYSHPLNEYYISSSHNTYLRGRQVAGDSSIEGYIKVLQRGCKCVEVDVWDPPSNINEPIVNHGRTLTVPISFSNVIKTIKKYAFITSPFPVIISLEIHCSTSNQRKLVEIVTEELGDSLVKQPIIEDSAILPSPLELKYKFLIKVKKTSKFANLIATEDGSYISTSTSTSTQSEDNESYKKSFLRRKHRKTKIDDCLSDLGIYLQGLKFINFSLPESKTFNHCFSLSENSINSMLKDEEKRYAIDKHNRRYFMRIYPSRYRVKSSNFNPINYWIHGAQMVATNWQTYDLGQQLNEAMFEGVKRLGYLLKPPSLRKPLLKTSKVIPVPQTKITIPFSITIISAHHLPKAKDSTSAINPFVSFEIIGVQTVRWDDPSMAKGRTSIITENGFNPIWNETFSGTIEAASEVLFVRFCVNSSSSYTDATDFAQIGIVASKLNCLKQGYRYIPILDLLGEELVYSTLFVQITIG